MTNKPETAARSFVNKTEVGKLTVGTGTFGVAVDLVVCIIGGEVPILGK
jgi:hypothetical protein